MGQKAFISDVDRALSNLIWNSIKNENTAKNIMSSQEQISFSSPKATGKLETRKLSIFLYNVTEETSMRNMPTVECAEKRSSQTSLALHYLVTPFTGNDRDDHVLLENIIHALLATPPIVCSDEGDNAELSVKMDPLSLEELSKLWVALGAPLRLSVCLTVSSAEPRVDAHTQVTGAFAAPQTPALDTTNVTQLYQAVLKTFTDQSNGWKKRNIVVKQWVLQNFQTNTGMTAEEMLTTLNSLGDKLEQHGSTEQFIKPLNLLAGYYKHQLDELKGMHKVSHKQGENLETINTWIKDIKTLIEPLGS